MSAGERIVGAIRSTGLPVTHLAWPEQAAQGAPPLPWCVWREDGGGEFFAQGENWAQVPRFAVELYERAPDAGTHEAVESAIREAFGPTRRYESWVEEEHCLMTTWYFNDTKREETRDGQG